MGRTATDRVIVFGVMFDLPFAGIILQVLQYLIGLRRLGWDVWYVEDSHAWPYDPSRRDSAPDASTTVRLVAPILDRYGFGDRWVHRSRFAGTECFGAGEAVLDELYRTADVALNVTAAQELRDEHMSIPLRVYVQSDPFAVQVDAAHGDAEAQAQLAAHHRHFSFGELVGTPECLVPSAGYAWQPTRQPVVLDMWRGGEAGAVWTTISTWHNATKDRIWEGERYSWTKDREFLSLLDLPSRTRADLELAIDGDPPEDLLTRHGWRLAHAPELRTDPDAYRRYIRGSRGELTVARDQYVRPRTGWFSDRSACYLAAGRPVVTQATGFEQVLPTGAGLFAFTTVDDAAAALDVIEDDHARHAAAALGLVEEHFKAEQVLARLLARATANVPTASGALADGAGAGRGGRRARGRSASG